MYVFIDEVAQVHVDFMLDAVRREEGAERRLQAFCTAGFGFVRAHRRQAQAIFTTLNGPDELFRQYLFQAYEPLSTLPTMAYTLEQPARVRRLVLVGTCSGGPAYRGAPGALWNRSHPAFWRMALLGILYTLWSRRAMELLCASFIERHSYYDQGHWRRKEIRWADWLRRRREGAPGGARLPGN